MANVLGDLFSDIAGAIREKTGETDKMKPASFPEKIRGISGTSEDVRYVTFMNEDGTVEYGKKPVAVCDDCADPIARGVFSTPTKESTPQYNYTFGGWATTPGGGIDANALKAVNEDRIVYANFISVLRYYTITFYDSDGTTVLKTESLPYGAMPAYTPEKVGFIFLGWNTEITTVTDNANYVAKWKSVSGFGLYSTIPISMIQPSGTIYKIAVNNAGTKVVFAVYNGSFVMQAYDITGDSPLLISGASGLYNETGCDFSYDDSKLAIIGYNSSSRSTSNFYSVTENTITFDKSETGSAAAFAYSPVSDIYGYSKWEDSMTKYKLSDGTYLKLEASMRGSLFSPDGKHVAISDDYKKYIEIGDITTGTVVKKLTVAGNVKKVSYNADGSLLAVSHDTAPYVEVYDTSNYSKIFDLSEQISTASYAELFGENWLVVGNGSTVLAYEIENSGVKEFEYNIPEYSGGSIENIYKNHNNTSLLIRGNENVEVWAKT